MRFAVFCNAFCNRLKTNGLQNGFAAAPLRLAGGVRTLPGRASAHVADKACGLRADAWT